MDALPVLAADLTFVRVNGGRGYGSILDWDEAAAGAVGQRVTAAGGGSERCEAVITEIRDDVIVLSFPQFVGAARLGWPA